MVTAIHRDSTLCLNQGNHPSIPAEGLELVAGVPTIVTAEQVGYLRSIGVEVADDTPTPAKPKKGA